MSATRSVANVVAMPAPFSHTLYLHGLTANAIQAAVRGEQFCSPRFSGGGSNWYLKLFIGGDVEDAAAGHISAYLVRECSSSLLSCDFSIAAFGKTRSISNRDFPPSSSRRTLSTAGWARFVSRAPDAVAWLVSNKEQQDTLAITCTVHPRVGLKMEIRSETEPVSDDDVVSSACAVVQPELMSQLRALLSTTSGGAGADCTLVCGADGERFPAHTFILSLRSNVFMAQLNLNSPLAAKDRAHVPVPPEIESPVMRKLLEHVYTDEEVVFEDVEEVRRQIQTVPAEELLLQACSEDARMQGCEEHGNKRCSQKETLVLLRRPLLRLMARFSPTHVAAALRTATAHLLAGTAHVQRGGSLQPPPPPALLRASPRLEPVC